MFYTEPIPRFRRGIFVNKNTKQRVFLIPSLHNGPYGPAGPGHAGKKRRGRKEAARKEKSFRMRFEEVSFSD